MTPFRKHKAFTLTEIIVTMGIMALIATIAIPHFIHARKRAQAVRILEGLRLIEAAKDQWAIEKNRFGDNSTPAWSALRPYIQSSSPLARQQGETVNDLLGNPYTIGDLSIPPSVSKATYDDFVDFVTDDFWGSYWRGNEP